MAATTTKRTYEQYCAAARALDVIGERWSLLIIRDLLLGPRRYTDLLAGLPGIGPNVLAARLRELQASGVVVKRQLPPPAASTVYELTPLGEGLRGVARELASWGMQLLGAPRPGEHFRISWLLSSIEASFAAEQAEGLRESYEFRIDGEVFTVAADDGSVEVRSGHATDPAMVLTTDVDTFLAVGAHVISAEEAARSGRAQLEGDVSAAERVARIMGPNFAASAGGGGIVGAVRNYFASAAPPDLRAVIAIVVDGRTLRVDIRDGEVDVREAKVRNPDVTVTTDAPTLAAIGIGRLAPGEAAAAGRATVTGDGELLLRLAELRAR